MGEGKLVTMFLDEGFGCAQDFDKAENLSQEIKKRYFDVWICQMLRK